MHANLSKIKLTATMTLHYLPIVIGHRQSLEETTRKIFCHHKHFSTWLTWQVQISSSKLNFKTEKPDWHITRDEQKVGGPVIHTETIHRYNTAWDNTAHSSITKTRFVLITSDAFCWDHWLTLFCTEIRNLMQVQNNLILTFSYSVPSQLILKYAFMRSDTLFITVRKGR